MRSPKAVEASRRSTTFSQALGVLSARNASTSSIVGGSPVRSNVTRRMSVARDNGQITGFQFLEGVFLLVQAQAGLAFVLVRPMAGVTILGEDGTNVPVVIHAGLEACIRGRHYCRLVGTQRRQQQAEQKLLRTKEWLVVVHAIQRSKLGMPAMANSLCNNFF